MIPPPNVTGTLHMGHAFQDTIMDALTRYHRMRGDDTLWQMGTDHAGIATQMVVERQLNAAGTEPHATSAARPSSSASGNGRQHPAAPSRSSCAGSARRSTGRANASRWTRASRAPVTEVFVRLHEEGLIYRGKRLVNWDPVLLTALSDLEVLSTEEEGSLWHLRYPLEDGSGHLVVATTRPETLLGDSAVAVHPEDERYRALIGKRVRLPLTDRLIPVIADDFVDREFGSGCVKITPAHDFTDNEVGQRHDLPLINIFTPDARLNDNVPERLRGLTREKAREQVLAELEAAGLIERIDKHKLDGAARRPQRRHPRALAHRPVVRAHRAAGASPPSRPSNPAASASCRRTGRRPTSSGCATSATGASAASCGGVTRFPPGMTPTAMSTSRAREAEARAQARASTAPTSR